MSKSVNLSQYETIAEATARIGAKSLSTVSKYAKTGRVRSVAIQEGSSRKTYVRKEDIDKMVIDFSLRQQAAAALKQGDASTIQAKFSRWSKPTKSTAKPTPSQVSASATAVEKFWESSDYQNMLRKIVSEAVEAKLREIL